MRAMCLICPDASEEAQGDQRGNGKEGGKATTHENDVPDVDFSRAARATAIFLQNDNFSIFGFLPAEKIVPEA